MKRATLIAAALALGVALALAWALMPPNGGKTNMPPNGVTPAPTHHPKPPKRHTVAILVIPRLHLRSRIYWNQDLGPAWWPVTGRPGGGDTIAIAGHRLTHKQTFLRINIMRPGDRIYVRWDGRWYAYRMTGYRILSAQNLHIADATGHEHLLISACTRLDGTPTDARWRYVVYAQPVPSRKG